MTNRIAEGQVKPRPRISFAEGENVRVIDGPFAETKEQLAGFYMIDADNLDEAIRIASGIPPARVGSIEDNHKGGWYGYRAAKAALNQLLQTAAIELSRQRPLAVVVLKPGQAASAEELVAFLAPRFARWWLPDAVEFVDTIPRTSTGKFLKRGLRERFRDRYRGQPDT